VPADGVRLEVWTATDVARVLRVSRQAVIAEIRDGRMPGNAVAGEWRVRAAALVEWLDGAYGERRAQRRG
jgi:excisionase family DNA binding protein